MRSALAILTITIAFCLWGYLALSWGPLILREGFESAITERSTQPPFPVTAVCLLASGILLFVGIGLAFTRKRD
jgi:hypothetical protein